MKSYGAVFVKECLEFIRTYKLLLLVAVFIALAIMSPATAFFMRDILEAAGINPAAINDPSIQNPTYLASFQQFFSNVGQIGLLVLAIIFAGITANDIAKQTIVPFLAKGLRRSVVIYAKLSVAILLWAAVYLISLAVMFGYTAYYFELHDISSLILPLVALFEFGVILITLLVLGGVVFKSQIGALLTAGGFVLIATLLGVFIPHIETFNPLVLSTHGLAVASGSYATGDFIIAMWIGAGVILSASIASVVTFRRTQF